VGLTGKIGARLTHFLPRWQEITSDPEVLDIVSGMHVDVDESALLNCDFTPHQHVLPESDAVLIDEHLIELIDKDVVATSVPERGQFVSPTFLVLKKLKGSRMILNLKKFNKRPG